MTHPPAAAAPTAQAPVVIAALYHFADLPDFAELQGPLAEACERGGVFGTLLLASEGVNGTIAGPRAGIDAVLDHLRADARLAALEHKESYADRLPFKRLKVRLKKEIVTMGVPGTDPRHLVGTYVEPEDWNDLISDPDVVVVDTRNDYEVEIGTFRGAQNPNTRSFREFPDYVQRELGDKKDKKVAMFCTGGIRCEKSTSYLKSQGFDQVFHLKGGILNYLETVPKDDSLWDGECFVFDERVTVDADLQPGNHVQCFACRRPVSPEAQQSESYLPGVSCPACVAEVAAADRARFAERQKQIELARERGQAHLAADPAK